MKFTTSNRDDFRVQMTLNFGCVVNPRFLCCHAHPDEPAQNTQNSNEYEGRSNIGFKVQTGSKIGSLNPTRFTGSRAYMYARNLNLALLMQRTRTIPTSKPSFPPTSGGAAPTFLQVTSADVSAGLQIADHITTDYYD